jgi:hypothetical protein
MGVAHEHDDKFAFFDDVFASDNLVFFGGHVEDGEWGSETQGLSENLADIVRISIQIG